MRSIRLIPGSLVFALAIITACDDASELLTPPSRQASTVAPMCFGLAATIYEGMPGAGSIVTNGSGGMNITGTAGNDVIVGSAFADSIFGLDGTDRICAADGDDVISGGPGTNRIEGGLGIDALDYSTAGAGVRALLPDGVARSTSIIESFTGIENILGSAFDDDFRGDAGVNVFAGGDGNDLLNGLGAADTLVGQNGNDVLLGGDGDDVLSGGAGDDEIRPGLGADFIVGQGGDDTVNYTGSLPVDVNLATNTGLGGDAAGDTWQGIEVIIGTAGADALTGDADKNDLQGRGGNDSISGGGGRDRLIGGDGADNIHGGDDIDQIHGQEGDDNLFGDEGDDVLLPGIGFNTVDGGNGNDRIVSGNCLDTVTNVEVVQTGACSADTTTSTIEAADSSLVADGVTSATITVRLKDANGNSLTLGGRTVVMTTTAGTLTDGVTTATTVTAVDQNDGTYTLTLTSSGTLETATVTATVDGNTLVNDVDVAFVVGALAHFEVEASGGGDIGTQTSGVAFNIDVTAHDAGHHVVDHSGTIDLTYEGAASGTLTSGAMTNGVVSTHSVTISEGANVQIRATENAITGLSNAFVVGAAPNAVADSVTTTSVPTDAFHTALNTSLVAADASAQDLTTNDTRGFPLANIASFGAIEINDGAGNFAAPVGAVTTNAAGDSVAVGDGGLKVNADGSFIFDPPTNYTGLLRFQYRLTNSLGSSDATVTLAVGVRPAAGNDTYSGGTLLGNVSLDTNTGTVFSVSANDAGDQRVIALNTPVASTGNYTLNTDGTFTYQPAAGFGGAAGFTYNVTNGFGMVTGTVDLTVGTSRVWFVDGAVGVSGTGTQASPFKGPADITNSGALPNPQDNDVIFVHQNASAYVGSLTLRAGQKLVGQDATVSLQTIGGFTPATHQALPAMDLALPATTLTSAATTVTLNSGNTLRGFTLGNATTSALTGTGFGTLTLGGDVVINNASGGALSLTTGTISGNINGVTSGGGTNNIALTNVSGTVDFGSGALSGATGSALLVDGSAGTFTYNGTITTAGTGRPATIQNRSGGGITLSGNITSTGAGILIQNNTGGTYNFSGTSKQLTTGANAAVTLTTNTGATFNFSNGGLAISTSTGLGFRASGGGTLSISGANNTVAINGAQSALWLTGLTVGSDDITFASINSTGTATGSPVCLETLTGSATQTVSLTSVTIPATSAASPGMCILNNSAPITIGTATIDNTAAAGIQLTGNTAAVAVNAGTIGTTNDPTGNVIDVEGGSADVTIVPSLTKSTSGRIVEVTGHTAGTVTFSGALSCSSACTGINVASNTGGSVNFTNATKNLNTGASAAVTLTNNTGATVNFTGNNFDIDVTSGAGFTATGGGTVNISGTNNTVNATAGGTAVNIANTTIGGSGVTFARVDATGGGTNGIVLNNTGAGSFLIDGGGEADGANTTRGRTTARQGGGTLTLGAGGTISGRTGDGISVSTAGAITLRNMVVSGGSADGIDVNNATSLVLDNIQVTGHTNNRGVIATTVGGLRIRHADINSNATSAAAGASTFGNVQLENVTGTDSIANSFFNNAHAFVFKATNTTGTHTLNVINTQITGATTGIAAGLYAGINAGVPGTITANFQNDSIGHSSARGLQAATGTSSAGVLNLTVNNTAFRNNFVGMDVAHGSSGTHTFNLTNNRLQTNVASSAMAINVNRLGSPSFNAFGVFSGTISGNTIGTAGTANSGSDTGSGIEVESNGSGGITRVAVVSNTIREVALHGIALAAVDDDIGGGGPSTLEARVQNNSISNMDPVALDGINAVMGALNTDNPTMCFNITGNTTSAIRTGIRLRTSGLPAAQPTVRFQGWDGVTAITTFLANQNPAATGGVSPTSYSNSGGGTTTSATCTTP